MIDFEERSEAHEPSMFDIEEYLEFRTSEMKFGSEMRKINNEINKELLEDPNLRRKSTTRKALYNETDILDVLVNLKAMIDSEVIICIPMNETYLLYEIHRKSYFTRLLINPIGYLSLNGETLESTVNIPLMLSSVSRRKDLQGTVLRAVSALIFFDNFGRNPELTRKTVDRLAIKGLQVTQLAEQQFNFKMAIKCFDEYGWETKQGFTGMLRHLAEQRTDMMTSGMLLITNRMNAASYINNIWPLRMGLWFKQPALPQVSNIFILPFSTGVWLSIALLLAITIFVIFFQFGAVKSFEGRIISVEATDVVTFVTGAACQQGTELDTVNISTRITMFIYLTCSIFLFTSYTANVVSLLQSSSNTINTIKDVINSDLEMGVENINYEVVLVEEDNDPNIRELYRRKLNHKNKTGEAYFNCSHGMTKVRKELYAFHAEEQCSTRFISDTFLESEKCRLKLIPLFPNRNSGHAVPKKSPYWEMLAQGYRWYEETGFVQRTQQRFSFHLQKCPAGSGGGYNSIGVSDIDVIFKMLLYGISISTALLVLENFHYFFTKKSRRRRRTLTKITTNASLTIISSLD